MKKKCTHYEKKNAYIMKNTKCIHYEKKDAHMIMPNLKFEPVVKLLVYFVGFRKGLNPSELNSSYKTNSH